MKIKSFPNYPPLQFSAFRIIFGMYLCIHFLHLLPYSPDIWSQNGMLGQAELNFTFGKFPNLLYWLDTPLHIQVFISVLALFSLFIAVGFYRPFASLLLWYGWACLFHRNNLISNPGLPMVGFLLLALTLIPTGEPLSFKKAPYKQWFMPSTIYWGAWWITALAYSISGFDKWLAPSWRDGSAIIHLLHNPLARDWFIRDLFLQLPELFLKIQTWFALILEISYGVLCLFKWTRPLAWFLIVGMHFGILMVVDFPDLTFGVLMIHLFTFNPHWFKPKPISEKKVILFDGVCGLCNGWVNFLLAQNSGSQLLFSPLQGEFAKTIPQNHSEKLDTIVFVKGEKIYTRSNAVLMILKEIGGIWIFTILLYLIPRIVRDYLYNWISANRYQFFGKHETCRMPTPEERDKFIP